MSNDEVILENDSRGVKTPDPVPPDGKCHDLEATVNRLVLSMTVLQSKLDAMESRPSGRLRKAAGGVPSSGRVTPEIQVTDATPTVCEVDAVHGDLHRQSCEMFLRTNPDKQALEEKLKFMPPSKLFELLSR